MRWSVTCTLPTFRYRLRSTDNSSWRYLSFFATTHSSKSPEPPWAHRRVQGRPWPRAVHRARELRRAAPQAGRRDGGTGRWVRSALCQRRMALQMCRSVLLDHARSWCSVRRSVRVGVARITDSVLCRSGARRDSLRAASSGQALRGSRHIFVSAGPLGRSMRPMVAKPWRWYSEMFRGLLDSR